MNKNNKQLSNLLHQEKNNEKSNNPNYRFVYFSYTPNWDKNLY